MRNKNPCRAPLLLRSAGLFRPARLRSWIEIDHLAFRRTKQDPRQPDLFYSYCHTLTQFRESRLPAAATSLAPRFAIWTASENRGGMALEHSQGAIVVI